MSLPADTERAICFTLVQHKTQCVCSALLRSSCFVISHNRHLGQFDLFDWNASDIFQLWRPLIFNNCCSQSSPASRGSVTPREAKPAHREQPEQSHRPWPHKQSSVWGGPGGGSSPSAQDTGCRALNRWHRGDAGPRVSDSAVAPGWTSASKDQRT